MKKLKLLCVSLLLSIPTFAQFNGLQNFENTWIKPLFPIVAGIVFIVGALMNLGNFFGENRDMKKGIVNMLIYAAVVFSIGGLYVAIRAVSLN